MGAGNDSYGLDWRLKIRFFFLPASLWEHFGSLWMGLGGSWARIELILGTMVPNWTTGSYFWRLQAALWVGLGAP